MKKNLRIVSAAAAALMTVAPVVASSVSTVFADSVSVPGTGSVSNPSGTTTPAVDPKDVQVSLSLTNNNLPLNGQHFSALGYTLSSNAGTIQKTSAGKVSGKVTISDGTTTYTEDQFNSSSAVFDKSKAYTLKIEDIYVSGLGATTAGQYNVTDQDNQPLTTSVNDTTLKAIKTSVSIQFHVRDTEATGQPYALSTLGAATEKFGDGQTITVDAKDNNVVALRRQILGEGDNDAVVTPFKGVDFTHTTDSNDSVVQPSDKDIETAIKSGLTAANVTPDSNNNFSAAAAFTFTVSVKSKISGKTAKYTFKVNPKSAAVFDKNAPVIEYDTHFSPVNSNKELTNDFAAKIGAPYNGIPVGGTIKDSDVLSDIKAYDNAGALTSAEAVSGATESNFTNVPLITAKVDTSKVNTKVAGKYPITVTATNVAGKTTTATIEVYVGLVNATYKTVSVGAGLTIPVYTIEGNKVTTTSDTVKDGDKIAIFGDPVTVNGTKYSHINSSDGDKFVETKYIDGSYVPAASTPKKVMHASYVYDKDHKRVGTKRIASYTEVQVTGDPVKLSDGVMAYAIGDNQYIVATNIDGTKLTLRRNAYIYSTSKKHQKKSMKKGSTVTVYGDPYTFKDGKKYYRIGEGKQYIKVANV